MLKCNQSKKVFEKDCKMRFENCNVISGEKLKIFCAPQKYNIKTVVKRLPFAGFMSNIVVQEPKAEKYGYVLTHIILSPQYVSEDF